MSRHLHCRRVALCTGVITLLVQVASVRAQEPPSLPHQAKFADAGGVRLHYIDFGGEGLPVILVPAVTRDATHYGPLGPLLAAPNRVLAITRRGDGESEDPGGPYDAQTQARDFLHFMDALEIPQAVFVSNVGDEITYLAEEHPHRVAGLVFLGGPARGATGEVLRTEPSGMAVALRRLWQSAAGLPPDYFGYVPRYLESDTPTIGAPALVFVTTDGTRGVERENPALLMVGSPLASETVRGLRPEDGREHFERLADDPEYRDRTLAAIPDSVARTYFQRLAGDTELQAQVHRFQEETLMPAEIAHWNAFRRAFAGTLTLVQLDVPAVSGYEYNSAPELIAPHIRRFLEELGRRLDGRVGEEIGVPLEGVGANGSGIWVSAGRDENEIVGNTFDETSGAEIAFEADRDRVGTRSASDSVRDLATDNGMAQRAAGMNLGMVALEVVHVAPPTGSSATDRASILAALDQARPGSTVQFAQGLYLVGEIIPIQTPRITLLGHPDGTTLRGCDPAAYEEMERDAAGAGEDRDNTIEVQRVPFPAARPYDDLPRITDVADSTIVGVPLLLTSERGEAPLEDNLIEGNRFLGAEGIAIELSGGTRNRIINNTFSAVRIRDPFPGNGLGAPPTWERANGSAIWVSPGSVHNEIAGNTFEDIAAHAVVFEGDSNRVQLLGAGDAVRDLGSGNHASGPAAAAWVDPSPHAVRLVTVAPGVRIEVLDWGGTGEPLVLLAGMMATAHTFDEFAPGLTDAFRVLAITRRGFGASSQPETGYDMTTLVNDVRSVLDTLGIERAAFVGHSFGAQEIMRFASLWPERVSHVVNLDGMLVADIGDFIEVMSEVPAWPPPGDAEHASVAAFSDYLTRVVYGVRLPEAEIRARWRVLSDGRVGEEITPPWIGAAIMQGTDPTPLDGLSVAVLVLRNVTTSAAALIPWYDALDQEDRHRADRAFPGLQRVWAAGWAPFAEMRSARIVDFIDASHTIYISHKREVIDALRDFLIAPVGRPNNGK